MPEHLWQGWAITHQVGHVMDILPTLAELAGTRCPEKRQGKPLIPVEGRSLVPVLKGGTRRDRESLYWYGPHTGAGAVRRGRWKLVSAGAGKAWELYDMVKDGTETDNLAGQQPQPAGELGKAWFAWAGRTGVTGKMPPRRAVTIKGRD